MTIQELENLANKGDTQAMIALGHHYYDQYEATDFLLAIKKSLPWYERAGRNNSADGAGMALTMYAARVAMEKEAANWSAVCDCAKQGCNLSAEFLRQEKIRDEIFEEAEKCMNQCIYASSLVMYLQEDYEDAIESLDGIGENSEYYGLITILTGLCLCDTDRDLEGYEKLTILDKDLRKLLPKVMDAVDEELLQRGVQYYALYCRVIEKNTNKAYELLNRGLEVIRNTDVRQLLLDELTHYRKKLLGGYKYVE